MYTDLMDKGSRWMSLLSALLNAGFVRQRIALCEIAPGQQDKGMSTFEFGFWDFDPEGNMVAYRAGVRKPPLVWEPVETPAYTGYVMPWSNDVDLSGESMSEEDD